MSIQQQPDRRLPSLGELIAASLIVVGAILGFWINTSVRLAILEKESKDNNDFKSEIRQNIKEINSNVNDIKLTLKDKKDK